MATSENNDIQVKNDPRDNMPRYIKDIEEDITPARKLLEEYSKVPPDQVVGHIHAVVCLPTIASLFLFLASRPSHPSHPSPPKLLLWSYAIITNHALFFVPLQRERAWKIHPNPCVGRFRFLDLSISLHPLYPAVLARLRDS